MAPKLYIVPGSHPCEAAEAALRVKGLDYATVVLLPVVHKPIQRLLFGRNTVPGLRLDDGEKVVGSKAIMRRLDRLAPDPPLFPADPERRARVEEAESWGDEVLQPLGRRVTWAAIRRDPKRMRSYVGRHKLPLPTGLAMSSAGVIARISVGYNGASQEAVRADLRGLPEMLDRVDGWIAEEVVGGEQPNAADLQIGASIALLRTMGDTRGMVAGRPCERLATRWFADYAGDVPEGTLPAEWLAGATA